MPRDKNLVGFRFPIFDGQWWISNFIPKKLKIFEF